MAQFSHLMGKLRKKKKKVEQSGFRDRPGIKIILDKINVSIHFYMLRSTPALSL